MSAICGIVDFKGASVDCAKLRKMVDAAPWRGPNGVSLWTGENAGLAHMAFHATTESVRERQPLSSGDGRYVLVADARIDNREDLISALGGEASLPLAPTDADLVLGSFLRWGVACAERLLGDFVFAVWDRLAKKLILVRDAMGGRSVSYRFDGRRCIFASETGQILQAMDFVPRINEARLADRLISEGIEGESSFFKCIFYCPPAHALTFTSRGIRKRRYWDFDASFRIRYGDDRHYAEHFLELLTAATRCRLRSVGPVGLCLSGGLDSSLLAAVTARLLPETGLTQGRLKTFSYVFDELKSCDEREYIQPVVDRYGLDAAYIPCDDKWALRDLPRWPIETDFLWSDCYALLPATAMDVARKAGCRLLLNGQFGDALFVGGRYWAANLFYERQFGALFRGLQDHGGQIEWRRDLFDYGLRLLIPKGLKRLLRRFLPRRNLPTSPIVSPDFLKRAWHPESLDEDARWRKFRNPSQQGQLYALSLGSWSQGFGEARRFHNRFGIEGESPYHDRRLAEFVMAVPAEQLGRPWRNRWVQRNAMEGLVPSAVRERRDKTAFFPLLVRGLEREKETVRRLLQDPRCVRQGIVHADWLTQAVRDEDQSADSAFLLWACLSLELWLDEVDKAFA